MPGLRSIVYVVSFALVSHACGGAQRRPVPERTSLTVKAASSGAGVVESSPAGLRCHLAEKEDAGHLESCTSREFVTGQDVFLRAIPDEDSIFAGWIDAPGCGNGDCLVDPAVTSTVTASFRRIGGRERYAWVPDEAMWASSESVDVVAVSDGFVAAGSFEGTLALQSKSVDSDARSVFLAKFDTNGSVKWLRAYGKAGARRAWAMAVVPADKQDKQASDRIVIGGVVYGDSSVKGSVGGGDAYVLVVDVATGSVVWEQAFGGSGEDSVTGIAIHESAIYLAGNCVTDAVFCAGGASDDQDTFVMKLVAEGKGAKVPYKTVWNKPRPNPGWDYALGLEVDAGGNPILAASFVQASDTSFGLVQWNAADGAEGWKLATTTVGFSALGDIALVGGRLWLVGVANGTVTWSGPAPDQGLTLDTGGRDAVFVTSIATADPKPSALRVIGEAVSTYPLPSLAVTEEYLAVAGGFQPSRLTGDAVHGNDAAIALLSTKDLSVQWTKVVSSADPNSFAQVEGITIDASARVNAVGTFFGKVAIDDEELSARGSYDAFLLGVSPGGATGWARGPAQQGSAVSALVNVPGTDGESSTIFTAGVAPGDDGDGFVRRIDVSGRTFAQEYLEDTWEVSIGGSGPDGVTALARKPNGELLVAGFVSGPSVITAGDTTQSKLTAIGEDILLATVTTDGLVTSSVIGGAGDQRALAMAQSGDDVFLVGTYTGGPFAVGTVNGKEEGKKDLFYLRIDKAGNITGGVHATDGDDVPTGIAVTSGGKVLVVGATSDGTSTVPIVLELERDLKSVRTNLDDSVKGSARATATAAGAHDRVAVAYALERALVVTMTADGTTQRLRLPRDCPAAITGMSLDNDGSIVIVGWERTRSDETDECREETTGFAEVYVASEGQLKAARSWRRPLTSSISLTVAALARTAGEVVIGGSFVGKAQFESTERQASQQQGFVLSIAVEGSP